MLLRQSSSLNIRRWIAGVLLVACSFPLHGAEAWDRVQSSGELRWGADATGGAPYIYRDPSDPHSFLGFEVEVMDAVARRLHLRPTLVLIPWDELVPALLRDNFDMAFNGLEITPGRQEIIDFSIPYYIFSEQITVRRGDFHPRSLTDLHQRRVGTLSASYAQTLMEKEGGINVVTYPSAVEIYKDLELGRTDAALLDLPIAAWYALPNPHLENVGPPLGRGYYAGGIRKDSPVFREKINGVLSAMIQDGELQAIYKKWNLWTDEQGRLADAVSPSASAPALPDQGSVQGYLGLIVRGAGMTLLISILSMVLAIGVGFLICLGRVYGRRWVRALCLGYVEITRGTPLLIQLYVLYYGLPNIGIQLNAFVAAVLGMGFNYAAYESEIYRTGLLSVPKGQDEAARSLGLTTWQSLWHVLLPQSIKTILPPSTNDFIALFKDTSLVSIITVTELTRAYSQAATATFRFLELGLLTAALYLMMSLPLSFLSRRLEAQTYVVH